LTGGVGFCLSWIRRASSRMIDESALDFTRSEIVWQSSPESIPACEKVSWNMGSSGMVAKSMRFSATWLLTLNG